MYDPLSNILTLITICIHMRTEMIKRLITLWFQLRYQFQLQFLFLFLFVNDNNKIQSRFPRGQCGQTARKLHGVLFRS